MDKIASLIHKLDIQYKNKADYAQMLTTVMMLQQEISGAARQSSHLGNENVSVFMPKTFHTPAHFDYNIAEDKETYSLNLDQETLQVLNEDIMNDEELPDETIPDLETITLFVKEEKAAAKPAIDWNQFISLFRDNKTLMERSIKTAQKFEQPEEALEWLDNELAKKLSWDLDSPLVLKFYKAIIEKLD